MRNNNWNLVWTVIGIIVITMTFVNNYSYKNVFGFLINIWVYRAIWVVIAAGSIFSYLKRKNQKSE